MEIEKFQAIVEKRERFAKLSFEEITDELLKNKEKLQSLETELRSVELATDITPSDKIFRIPRIKTQISEIRENIEMLEELTSGKE